MIFKIALKKKKTKRILCTKFPKNISRIMLLYSYILCGVRSNIVMREKSFFFKPEILILFV